MRWSERIGRVVSRRAFVFALILLVFCCLIDYWKMRVSSFTKMKRDDMNLC